MVEEIKRKTQKALFVVPLIILGEIKNFCWNANPS